MTVRDLCCDICGRSLAGPAGSDGIPDAQTGVSLAFHPGEHRLGDKAGLLCQTCRAEVVDRLGADKPVNRCARCGSAVTRRTSLHVSVGGDPNAWQLCGAHAVEFLNRLRTVDPKLREADFRFPLAARD